MLLLSWFGWWYLLKFHEVRPFDWLLFIVEVAVLFVIAHETFYRPWRVRRWLRGIYVSFAAGQAILRRVPNGGPPELAQQWNSDANRWYQETQKVLERYSVQSAAAFVQHSVGPYMLHSNVHKDCQGDYNALADALENLKGIMEKPDIYF